MTRHRRTWCWSLYQLQYEQMAAVKLRLLRNLRY